MNRSPTNASRFAGLLFGASMATLIAEVSCYSIIRMRIYVARLFDFLIYIIFITSPLSMPVIFIIGAVVGYITFWRLFVSRNTIYFAFLAFIIPIIVSVLYFREYMAMWRGFD